MSDGSDIQRLEELFHQAVDLPTAEREAILEPLERDAPELAAQLRRLLDRSDRGDDLSTAGAFVDPTGGSASSGRHAEPMTLGAYRLLELVGQGGMGEVFRAARADGEYEQIVAVKRIAAGLMTPELQERFRFERQVLARLEHPNIARLLDGSVAEDGSPYLVMEYVEGRPVTQYAEEERLTLPQRLELFRTVCRAVLHAHHNLVVHRDLKPSNILVSDSGAVKLLDFGIAKLLTPEGADAPDLTRTRAPVLTPGYASPEQVTGGPITMATDVYALGLLLYELLCGERAQQPEDSSFSALERCVLEVDPVRPSEALLAGTPEEVAQRVSARGGGSARAMSHRIRRDLDNIVAMATRKDVERRYPSAQQLLEDIERHGAGHPVLARPDTFRYRSGKFLSRHRFGVFASGAVALSLVAGLVLALVGLARAQEEAETSDQVAEFLVSVFDAVDPELRTSGARATTAHELLESGLARIERARIDDPEVATRLELTVGRIARKVGEYDQAKVLLARVAGQATNSAVRRAALVELGAAQGLSGETDEAQATLTEAAALCRSAGDTLCVVDALTVRGEFESTQMKLEAARISLTEALESAKTLPESSKRRSLIAWITYGLATTEHRSGNVEVGKQLFERTEELYNELQGLPTLEAGRGYLVLGVARSARREFEQAADLLARARSIFVDLYGPRHLRVAYLDFAATTSMLALGDFDRAREAAENSLDIRRKVLGEDHLETGLSWGRMADVLATVGETEGALEAASRARTILKNASPRSYANVGRQLVELYIETDAPDAALSTAREVLSIYEEAFGSDHAMTLRGHASVAAALAAGDEADAAIASQERAIQIGDATLRPDHPRRAELLIALGEYEMQAGRRGRARETLEKAAALAESTDPPQPKLVSQCRALVTELAAGAAPSS